jgi:DNA polymerase-3 subunit delta'
MSFKDIKGQDHPIEMLKEYIKSSCVIGGYLFIGPEGVGKALVAKTLAKIVNCQEDNLDSCDRCISCLKIERNQHPDMHYISGSNLLGNDNGDFDSIKIDYIRHLQKDINLKPYEGKIKVFIIDNAHYLTAEASNALLKVLEEPPGNSLIILISSKPTLLFKTIISRCKIIRFSSLLRTELEEILKKEYCLDNNLAHFLAYFSEGRIGSALRLKDADILREKNRIIDDFILLDSKPSLDNLSLQNRKDVARGLNILAAWFRDIYLVKIGMPHYELINLDRKTQILRFMTRYTLLDLDEILKSISNSLLYLEQNVNIKLLLSNLMIELWKERVS